MTVASPAPGPEPDHDAPIVAELVAGGDWAALLRWWMARGYVPARQDALRLLRGSPDLGAAVGIGVAAWVETVCSVALEPMVLPPGNILAALSAEQRTTLEILAHDPVGALCVCAGETPPEVQPRLFATGVAACDRILGWARVLNDWALQAFYGERLATGRHAQGDVLGALAALLESVTVTRRLAEQWPRIYRDGLLGYLLPRLGRVQAEVRQWEASRASYLEAVALCREMAAVRPNAYLPDMAMTLGNLGNVQRQMEEPETAWASYREALAILRDLAVARPDEYRPDIARTLTNLGHVQRRLNEPEAARLSYQEALVIRRALAAARPDMWPDVATILDELGSVLLGQRKLEAARANLQESLAIRRELAVLRPDAYQRDLAVTLNILGNVLRELRDLDATRASYEEALAICRDLVATQPDGSRPDLAATLDNLGNVQNELNDLAAARANHQEALAIRRELAAERPDVHRRDVAVTLNNLGNLQHQLKELDAARASYEEALAIHRELASTQPDTFRPFVAGTLVNLSNLQRELQEVEAARASCQEALAIYRELAGARLHAYRPELATTLNSLGAVQLELREREAARTSYQEALAIRRELAADRPEACRPDLAATLSQLGNVHHQLNELEAARACHEEALAIYRELAPARPNTYRANVAIALRILGGVHEDLKDLEAVRACHEEALAIYRELAAARPDTYRPDVATTLNNLGNAYRELQELEAARASYQEALAIRRELAVARPDVYRPEIATTLTNLGNIHSELKEFESARVSYQEALAVRRELAAARPDAYRPGVATTLSNLGNLLRELNELELAREYCQESVLIWRRLTAARRDAYLPEFAQTLDGLGNVQFGLRELEAARRSYDEELTIWQQLATVLPGAYRPNLAGTLTNLGNIHSELQELEAARASYQEALAIRRELAVARPKVYRPAVASTLHNLGNLQRQLKELEAARASHEEALAIYRELADTRPEVYRPNVAGTLNNLGNLQKDLKEPEAARASYEQAIEILDVDNARIGDAGIIIRRGAHENLARLMRSEDCRLGWPDYRAAYRHLGVVCRLSERLRGKFRDETQRHRVLVEAASSFEQHVGNCVDLWDESCHDGAPDASVLLEALWAAEASRSRGLLDRLSMAGLTPARLTSEVEAALRTFDQKLAWARGRLARELCRSADGKRPGDGAAMKGLRMGGQAVSRVGEVEQEISDLEAAKGEVIARLRERDPDATPEPTVPAQDFATIRATIPTDAPTVFLEYAIGHEASCALLTLAEGTVIAVRLPALRVGDLEVLAAVWFAGYARAMQAHGGSDDRKPGLRQFVDSWTPVQTEVLGKVFDAALAPVLGEIDRRELGVERLVISSNKALHVFPLHACRLPDGRLLGEAFEISFTPSFSMLHRCTERTRRGDERLVVLENPMCCAGLVFTAAETAMVLARLRDTMTPTPLSGSAATRSAFIAEAEQARVLHYSGHAFFNGGNALESELELSGPKLTLGDVFSKVILRNNALTVLNGCETGLLKQDIVDDYVSFTTAFLFAGAPCVITTLWSVPDLTSALIMDEFYAQWTAGATPAAALRLAQQAVRGLRRGAGIDGAVERLTAGLDRELRDARRRDAARYVDEICGGAELPFADPVHWAAFTCNGLGFRRLE